APRRPRCAARIQRNDGELLHGAGRLPPGERQAFTGCGRGGDPMKRSGRAFLLLASFAAAAAMGGCRAATSQADAATPPADPPLPANRVRLAADQLGQIRIE